MKRSQRLHSATKNPAKPAIRRPLRKAFSDKPAIETCVACNPVQARVAADFSTEVRYFPPRGICVLALERANLGETGGDGRAHPLFIGAKSILTNSPHPAIAVLHQFFSNDAQDSDKKCYGVENANLSALKNLIEDVKAENHHWSSPQWLGPKAMEVTIYVAFKAESANFEESNRRRKPYVLDSEQKSAYKNRLTEIKSFIDKSNTAFSSPTLQPRSWTKLGATNQDFYLNFCIVPVLEDHTSSTDEVRYSLLSELCTEEFKSIANVYFRRTPDPGRFRDVKDENGKVTQSKISPSASPFKYFESHPYKSELDPLLAPLNKTAVAFRKSKQKVGTLARKLESAGLKQADIDKWNKELKIAKEGLKRKKAAYQLQMGRKVKPENDWGDEKIGLKSFRGNYAYLTGDCAPDENWWDLPTEKKLISIAEDLANVNKQVLGVLLFDGSWQGRKRGSQTKACLDERTYNPANMYKRKISDWRDAMSIGTNTLGADGKVVRLAATPPPAK